MSDVEKATCPICGGVMQMMGGVDENGSWTWSKCEDCGVALEDTDA